ncbi:MAG: hypothetical protein HY278_06180 [candidate division NC10 bacterium]|nr:hypothetical protein [candidate division NC10 bacterium]
MSILLATLAIFVAVSPVWAAIAAVDAAKDVASEEWGEAASLPTLSSDQSSPPSPDSKVGNSEGSKATQATDPKQETPVQPASASVQGAANSAVSNHKQKRITFKPGFRLQLREAYDLASGQNDVFLARLRLKAKGELFHVIRYFAELKIDNLGRRGKDPKAQPENAWLEYTVTRNFALRVGLYDLPFSRNALTSDSKLLLIDRSLIKDSLTSFGLADNTTGLLGHGRPFGGRFEYAAGIFNNDRFRRIGAPGPNRSDSLMPAGRVVVNLLDPAPRGGYADYQSSYLGKGKRLSIGTHFAHLRKAHDSVSGFSLFGWGTDVIFSSGPFTFEGEYDRLRKRLNGGNPDVHVDGWHVQTGYLVRRRVEFTARHQQLNPGVRVPDKTLRWTSVGSNVYIRGHNLKVQFDYTFRRGPGQVVKTDVVQLQMQADF